MFRRFALLGLLSIAPLCAQDNGYFFNAAVRVTISRSPFYPDLNFYGAMRMRDLQYPVGNPEYKAWWQITMVPEDPAFAAQVAALSAKVSNGHVTATGTHAGHMILAFTSPMGNWSLDITPMDPAIRQHIASVADDPTLNGDAGVQTITFMVGNDSMTVTAMQLAGAGGEQFFWQRPRNK